jgi:acyl transferase domain-containing protein
LSPDGKCYSFDHRSNGYSRGEGFGVVVLKRLSDAIRDGNTIRAVIRNTCSNQDGRSPGITQPTKQAQAELIRQTYDGTALDPGVTRYFEAHGTGTPVGDPIEASAISEVFTPYRSPSDPLFIGAVKSNVGHLEGAAGIAGLLKSVYVLERGIIPPNIWFEKANPKILDEWNFKFPVEPTLWPQRGLRRASVNSFGYGGSNAHVVLDDALHFLQMHNLFGHHRTVLRPTLPAKPYNIDGNVIEASSVENVNGETNGSSAENGIHEKSLHGDTHVANGFVNGVNKLDEGIHRDGSGLTNGINGVNGNHKVVENGHNSDGARKGDSARLFVFSSFDENGIQRLAQTYHEHLSKKSLSLEDEGPYLDDLSYTLASNRTKLGWRASVVARSLSSLLASLGNKPKAIRADSEPHLAFVFTGQGAQWFAMGRELIAYSAFSQSLFTADKYLTEIGCPWSLISELSQDKEFSKINDPEYSQPICTVLQIALVELLATWNVNPSAVVGHSSGEIAAAFTSGAISREGAWKLAYYRGKLSSQLARKATDKGGMLSAALDPVRAKAYIVEVDEALPTGSLEIACINSPRNVTISGKLEKINALRDILDKENVFARKLQVDNAYHSVYMKAIATEYISLIGRHIDPGKTRSSVQPKFYSSLLGTRASPLQLRDAQYWVDNLISPVRFSEATAVMIRESTAKTQAKKLGARSQKAERLTDLLEIGPHSALRGPLREILEPIPSTSGIAYESVLKRNANAVETFLDSIGWLFCRGYDVDLSTFNKQDAKNSTPEMLVDLPSYPFDHSKTYWRESRISKGYRFRKVVRHELLGTPVSDWNKNNAIWRNWIRLSENPWIKDHRITGSTLYPAAGMLVMAIEASKQLANPEKRLKGFRFKEISLHTALRVPSNADGVETHFYMRPYMDSTSSTSSNWSEFQLFSFEGDEWREHCRGLIQTEYEAPYTPVDDGLEDQMFTKICTKYIETAEQACPKNVSVQQLYELLQTVGFDFGPTFQTLSDVRIDSDRNMIATVNSKIDDIRNKMPHRYVQPHLIHPTTLDGVLQAVIVALTRGGREVREAMVPTSMRELWISADPDAFNECYRLAAHADFLGLRQAEASIIAINPVNNIPVIKADGFISTAVSGRAAQDAEESYRHLSFNLDWKPDTSFVDHETALRKFSAPQHLLIDPSEIIKSVEAICYMYLRRYRNTHPDVAIENMKPHHQKYMAWMDNVFKRYKNKALLHSEGTNWNELAQNDDFFSKFEEELASHGTPEGKLVVAVGRALPQILSGEIDPLQILFNDKLTENVYRFGTGAEIVYAQMCGYIDALAHKNPSMKILEVGAGTGGATVTTLQTLTKHGEGEIGARFERYDYSDISPSFFEQAREQFKDSDNRMDFMVLDIEKDPIEQGAKAEEYDLILAANVLHATRNIQATLTNVRKLLKPGGKLLLYELTNTNLLRAHFGFGLLPGWWLSEEPSREWGPLLSVPDWESHLKRTGFSGVDIAFEDFADRANQINCVMISTASTPATKTVNIPSAFIVIDDRFPGQGEIASKMQTTIFNISGTYCDIVPINGLSGINVEKKVCIFLPEIDGPFLKNITEEHFNALKQMVLSSSAIVWLTRGGGPAVTDPDMEMVTGFARAIRAEYPTLNFVTVAFENTGSAAVINEKSMEIFDSILVKGDKQIIDNTFSVTDGVIHIGRIIEANYMNSHISMKTTQPVAQKAKFGAEAGRALNLFVGSPGLLDTLQFDDDPMYDLPLQEGDVEFKTMACGLNFLDIMVSLGQVIGSALGVEGSGIVTRTGPNSKFQVGDRVCGIARGTMKTYSRALETSLVRMPDNLSWTLAASLPVVYVTAYAALYDIANIQKGETVLVHAAAGGVGQASIQLAQHRGAEIYATVGSLEKRDLLG